MLILILQRQPSNEAPFYSDKLHVRGHFASLGLGLCLGNGSETSVFFSEQVIKIVTLYFSICRRIMKLIFFSRAKNIESLLRFDMNIAHKGSVSGIVHFFET